MKKLLFILIILISPFSLFAQDIQIRSTSPYVQLDSGIAWTYLSNRVYTLTPLNPDQSMCVFVANNNPSNAHTFTVAVSQTGDTNAIDYSHNTGRYIADSIVGAPSPVAAATMQSFYVHSNAGAKIAIVFSGGATQAGSPDTADIFLVQTNALSCGPVSGGVSSIKTQITDPSVNQGCINILPVSTSASGNTQIIPVTTGNQRIYICHLSYAGNGASNVTITTGTGSNCGTGTTNLTGTYQAVTGLALDFGAVSPLYSPINSAVCLNFVTAVTTGGVVIYGVY